MTVSTLTALLKSGGPWAIIAVLLIAIAFLVRYVIKVVEDRDKRERERNEELLKLLEKKIETDVKHEAAFNCMAKAFDRVADKF